jgi:WD40 repeat protein
MKFINWFLSILLIFSIFQAVQAITPDCVYKTGKNQPILDLELAPNGEDIVAADGTMYLVNCKKKEVNKGWAATTIDISEDGSLIATASDINTCLFTIRGEKKWCDDNFAGRATEISISEDESRIIISSEGKASIYMIAHDIFTNSHEILWTRFIGSPIQSMAHSSKGKYIVVATPAEHFSSYDYEGNSRFGYTSESDIHLSIMDIDISKDGRYILGGSQYGNEGKIIQFSPWGGILWEYPVDGFAEKVSISEDGSYLAAGTNNIQEKSGNIYSFLFNHSSRNGTLLWKYNLGVKVNCLDMISDGSLIAVGTTNNQMMVFDRSGDVLLDYSGDTSITSIALSKDGLHLVAGSSQGEIFYFNIWVPPLETEIPSATIPYSSITVQPPSLPTTSPPVSSPTIGTPTNIPSISSLDSEQLTYDTLNEEEENISMTNIGEYSVLIGFIPFGLLGGAFFYLILLQRRKE